MGEPTGAGIDGISVFPPPPSFPPAPAVLWGTATTNTTAAVATNSVVNAAITTAPGSATTGAATNGATGGWGSSRPAGGALISLWGPPGLQGAPLYLCGVLPGCRGCSEACLWGSSWPAGGALMGQWGLLCPPGLQGVPLYHFGVLPACRGRPYISVGSSWPALSVGVPLCFFVESSQSAGGALTGQWDLCVLLACRGRPNGRVGPLCPPSLQGVP